MGLTQSLQNVSSFDSYHTLVERNSRSFYFGSSLQIYKNKFNPKQEFLKHTIKFQNAKDMVTFVQQIKTLISEKINSIPFNILYPINILVKQQCSIINDLTTTCNQKLNEVIVIHKKLKKSIVNYFQENEGVINEKLVWFIANQISKSLEILQEKTHASHYLMPQNVWCNQNENWFLYDGHFVLGEYELSNFYKSKIKQKQLISGYFKRKVEENNIISSFQSIQQDIYCMGYCLVYLMTGVHPRQMPVQSPEREAYVKDLLQAITQDSPYALGARSQKLAKILNEFNIHKYSLQLINFVKNIIKQDPKRRFTVRQMRNYLKSKQQQIFMNESEQWSRTTFSKSPYAEQMRTNGVTSSAFNRLKSPELYQNKLFSSLPQTNQYYANSIRTLKKQSKPRKIVICKKRPIETLPLNQNKNIHLQYENYSPIRKVKQVNIKQALESKKIRSTIQKSEKPISDGPQSQRRNDCLKKTHLPTYQFNQTFIKSPQKNKILHNENLIGRTSLKPKEKVFQSKTYTQISFFPISQQIQGVKSPSKKTSFRNKANE